MGKSILNRLFSIFLCMILAFGLTACGDKKSQPDQTEKSVMSAEKEEKKGFSAEAMESIEWLRQDMALEENIAGAVAYLGYRAQDDKTPLTDWMKLYNMNLIEMMPFLLEIPEENILGPGYGDVYCIVPRDEMTSLAVNYVTWKTTGTESHAEASEILYRSEYAEPVLIFVNSQGNAAEPDIEINLVANNGAEATWYPQVDEYHDPILPMNENRELLLMDFWYYGVVTGLEFPENLNEYSWWSVPTEDEIAFCNWVNNDWSIFMYQDNADPPYAGTVELYDISDMNYDLVYTGFWCMEGDCLRLEISDYNGYVVSGSFPVLMQSEGYSLHVDQEREPGVCPPFFEEGATSIDLWQAYG